MEMDEQKLALHTKIMQKLRLVKSIYIDEQKSNPNGDESFVV